MPARKDITGQRFGRLVAIRPTDRRKGTSVVWECRCDCGNTRFAPVNSLGYGVIRSCGCLRIENLDTMPTDEKLGQIENTNVSRIRSHAPQNNNKSGVRGVAQDKRSGKWVAYIYFQRKQYYLGAHDTIEEAAARRERAEMEIHGPFLEWYESQKRKEPPPSE